MCCLCLILWVSSQCEVINDAVHYYDPVYITDYMLIDMLIDNIYPTWSISEVLPHLIDSVAFVMSLLVSGLYVYCWLLM